MNNLVTPILSALAVVKDYGTKDWSLILNKEEQIALRKFITDILTENAELKWNLNNLKRK